MLGLSPGAGTAAPCTVSKRTTVPSAAFAMDVVVFLQDTGKGGSPMRASTGVHRRMTAPWRPCEAAPSQREAERSYMAIRVKHNRLSGKSTDNTRGKRRYLMPVSSSG